MLGVMTDKELDDPMSIDTSTKERVSRDTGKSVEEVSRLLQYYKQSLIVQQWLQLK
jgi:signal recognition particle GTPase